MRRLWKTVCILCTTLLFSSGAAAESPWTIEVKNDKMTDKQTLLAEVAGETDQGNIYNLVITCSDGSIMASLETFDAGGQGRPINWTSTIQGMGGGGRRYLHCTYRVDSEKAAPAYLNQQNYSNKGLLVPHTEASFPFVIPKNRLLIAGVFPDETAEFSFSALTSEERQLLSGPLCSPTKTIPEVPEPAGQR